MKPTKANPFSGLLVLSVCAALPAVLLAQNQNLNQNQPTSADAVRANEANPAIQRQAAQSSMEFAKSASMAGQKEIKLSKLALKKTQDDEVRSFAQMMVDQHTAMNRELKSITDKGGLQTHSTQKQSSDDQWSWEMERDEARKRSSAGVPGGSHQAGASQFPSDKMGRDRAYGTDVFDREQGSPLAGDLRDKEGRLGADGRTLSKDRDITGRDQSPESANRQYVRDSQPADHDRTNRSATAVTGNQSEQYLQTGEKDQDTDKDVVGHLDGLNGAAFDRAYLSEMVKDHTKAVAKFETASRTLANRELAAYVESSLPKLREHKEKAVELARKKGVELSEDNVNTR